MGQLETSVIRTRITMKGILLSLMLVCASAVELEDIAKVSTGSEVNGRKPKLFFVSSSSTVTTILTSTFCYVTAAAPATITTCKKKRRRSILSETENILPEHVDASNVESGIENQDSLTDRQGRFLLYWLTTTSTSTASFTKALSVATVYCPPSGASIC